MKRFKQNFIFFYLGAFLVVAILVWTTVFTQAQSELVKVHFLDVGQGKAVFIEAPDGNQILIDGGPDNSVLEKLAAAMPFFDREIDLLILTHPDSDHLNGLVEVLKRYEVDKIIETGIADSSAEYQVWHNLIKEKNIPVVFALAGQKIKIGKGLALEILYPNRSLVGESFSNTNQSSIVARLVYGQNSFLFTGDAEQATEYFLTVTGTNLDSDILDVSHHGSKNSSSEEFLNVVSPQTAIIQVGLKNRYSHPAQETLERLAGFEIFRTDICGNIDILSDGQGYFVNSDCK